MTYPVKVPLINPNEPEALLAELHVQEGQRVAAGDILATFETTKSTAELAAERGGFVAGVRWQAGQTVRAGEVLCYLAEQPDWTPPSEIKNPDQEPGSAGEGVLPPGLRITQPARVLADQLQVDLTRLPTDQWITEKVVRLWAETAAQTATEATLQAAFDPGAIIIYGGGGHSKALIDLLRALSIYRIIGVIDDALSPGMEILGAPLLGGRDRLPELYKQGVRLAVNAVGGIGDIRSRLQIFHHLAEAGFVCPALVHPTAFVEPSARLTAGCQIFPHAYVGSEARVGYGCIVNTGAVVSHDCCLDDYVNISPGALLAGEVQIGAGALVGMGATINLRVKVGRGARIGNGATVKDDVPDKGIVRAGAIWP